jgi:hypothetical protein
MILRDPTAETAPPTRPHKKLPPDVLLENITVALLDIGKTRGDEFMDHMQTLFAARNIPVRRYKKPSNTRTAPAELLQKIAGECQAVVVALSD